MGRPAESRHSPPPPAERVRGGFFAIPPTPFTADGEVDEASLVGVIRHQIEIGVDGLLLLAVASEAMFLTATEKRRIVQRVAREVGDSRPVLVAAYEPATHAVVEQARRWVDMGAAAVVVLPPYAVAPDAEAIVRHVDTVARAVDAPIFVQDEPNTSGVALSAELIARIAREVTGVAGFKVEGQPVTQKLTAVRAQVGKAVALFSAAGTTFLDELARGSDGIMTGYVYPELIVEVLRLFRAGSTSRARDLWERYLPLTAAEWRPGLGWSIRKEILHMRGLIATPAVRNPAPVIDADTRTELRDLLQRLDLLAGGPAAHA